MIRAKKVHFVYQKHNLRPKKCLLEIGASNLEGPLLKFQYSSNNFKVFGLYSCLKNWKGHIKTAVSQVKDIAGIVLNNEIGFVYEKDTHDNDYIILKLGSPLQFNENVQPACLPSSSSFLGLDSTKTSCFTSGWGKLSSSKCNSICFLCSCSEE